MSAIEKAVWRQTGDIIVGEKCAVVKELLLDIL